MKLTSIQKKQIQFEGGKKRKKKNQTHAYV